jgi:hypothetical protein
LYRLPRGCYALAANRQIFAGILVLDGLYKVEYGVNDAFGRSIMCMHDGRMLGGNSAFAHLGTYRRDGEEIAAEIITERHNDDINYKPLMGTDHAAISVRGRSHGNGLRFEGEAAPRPGALFWANLTKLDEEALPPVGEVGPGGIVNGLYSIRIRTLDGVDGGLSGVMLLIDGRILGGDAFFYYLGAYSSADGRWKGEIDRRDSRVRRPRSRHRVCRRLPRGRRRPRSYRARRQAQPSPDRDTEADAARLTRFYRYRPAAPHPSPERNR